MSQFASTKIKAMAIAACVYTEQNYTRGLIISPCIRHWSWLAELAPVTKTILLRQLNAFESLSKSNAFSMASL